jgi:hypothetical protein
MKDFSLPANTLNSHPGFVPGLKYSYPGVFTVINRFDGAYANNIYFGFVHLSNGILKNLYFTIDGGFISGATVRIGLYTIKNGLPDKKLFSTGITITSNGEKQVNLNLPIQSGWYAIAYYTTDAQRIPTVIAHGMGNIAYLYGLASDGILRTSLCYAYPTNTTLPDTFVSASYTANNFDRSPVVYFEY